MGEETKISSSPLHVAFLPFPAPGHTIPVLDMVRLLKARQVRTTVITTPLNAPNITKHLKISKNTNNDDDPFVPNIHIIPFPNHEITGLPPGIENQGYINSPKMTIKFIMSMELFQDHVKEFMSKTKINCLAADLFFTFATSLAKMSGIPRLVFHVSGFFPMCVMMQMGLQDQSVKRISSDDEPFIVPNLPHKITLTKSQLQVHHDDSAWNEFFVRAIISYMSSFGDVFNTFYELEQDYVEHYKKCHKRKVWPIGPVSLYNQLNEERVERGQTASICETDCLKWLDLKNPNSVVYLSFGTLTHFSSTQLKEIAIALENVEYNFIWVVRDRGETEEEEDETWLPDGFEKRVDGRGLIIKGWAPQVMILERNAIGAFVTHCGWNSVLEGFSAGVPMVTWPIHAEHFYVEKLVTDVVKIGVQVGNKKWSSTADGTFINHEKIEFALKEIMSGDESVEIRTRAIKLKESALEAVEEGGSSYSSLSNLIQELSSYSP